MPKARPYTYYDQATSLCTTCLRRIEAKLVIRDGRVWMYKWCPAHGQDKVLVASDAEYWKLGREVYIKPPEMPLRFNTEMAYGCPYDCGLCPDHMQHSCLTILEVGDHCNLRCPVCYADSGPHRPGFHDLATIERMLDAIVANEGEPDVVQISGGEPTLSPVLRRAGCGENPPDPPPDAQYQRHPGHERRRLRRPSRHLCAGLLDLPAVGLARPRGAASPARRGPLRRAHARARAAQCGRPRDDAGDDRGTRCQRSRNRFGHRLRGEAAVCMCEANAYIYKDGKEELYLENVDVMRPEEGKIFMKNLFGEQKIFEGEIREVSLLRHKIILEKK